MDRKGFKALLDLLKFAPLSTRVGEAYFEFMPRMAGESKISPTVVLSILWQCGRAGKRVSPFLERTFIRIVDGCCE